MAGPSADESRMLTIGQGLYGSGARRSLTDLSQMQIRSNAEGRTGLRSQLLGANAADAAAATAGPDTSAYGAQNRALTRAVGLSKLARHTSDQFDNTLLQERLGLVSGGRQRQSVGLSTLTQLSQMNERSRRGQQSLADQQQGFRSDAFGAAAGIGLASIGNLQNVYQKWQARRSAVGGYGAPGADAGNYADPTGGGGDFMNG